MPRDDAECVAEGAAYVTMHHFGIDTGMASFPYLAGWARDTAVLRRNLGEIQTVATALIGAIAGVGDPYADGLGSWDRRDEAAAIKEMRAAEDALEREVPDGA